jgi:hypothetical protein
VRGGENQVFEVEMKTQHGVDIKCFGSSPSCTPCNRTPTKKTAPISRCKRLTGNKPDLWHTRPFRRKVRVRVLDRPKLDLCLHGGDLGGTKHHFKDGTVFSEETREENQVGVPVLPKMSSD